MGRHYTLGERNVLEKLSQFTINKENALSWSGECAK
jgi:hypothetical protein